MALTPVLIIILQLFCFGRNKLRKEFILIKITQSHYLDCTFLQNRTTDFDETLHVVWVCPGKGFGTIGTFGYSLV